MSEQLNLFSEEKSAKISEPITEPLPKLTLENPSVITDITDEDREIFVKAITEKEASLTSVDVSLDGFSPWSYSKYKVLKKCPFQFYLKHIVKYKIPPQYQIQSDPVSANVGKAAHEILDYIMVGKTLEQAYKAVKKKYISDKILTEQQWTDRVDILNFNINQFKDRIETFNRANPIKRVFTELRLGVDKNFKPAGFFADDVYIRAVVDLILVLECMDLVIIDHKTGGGQGSVRPYKEQLDWYKVLFHYGIQKVEGIQTGVHFIGEGEIKMIDFSPTSDVEGNLKNSLMMGLEGAIELLYEKGYFKHVRGPYCKWCDYDNVGCKSGQLKNLELKTIRWIK